MVASYCHEWIPDRVLKVFRNVRVRLRGFRLLLFRVDLLLLYAILVSICSFCVARRLQLEVAPDWDYGASLLVQDESGSTLLICFGSNGRIAVSTSSSSILQKATPLPPTTSTASDSRIYNLGSISMYSKQIVSLALLVVAVAAMPSGIGKLNVDLGDILALPR